MNEERPHRFIPRRYPNTTCTLCGGTRERRYQRDHTWVLGGANPDIKVKAGDLVHRGVR